jgi:hypothetical protein
MGCFKEEYDLVMRVGGTIFWLMEKEQKQSNLGILGEAWWRRWRRLCLGKSSKRVGEELRGKAAWVSWCQRLKDWKVYTQM